MKKHLALLLLAASITTPASFAQRPGDTVTPAALGKLEWLQGEAPATWEPGKLYILECWATWCGPCIAAIPHVDELYDRFSSKGLRVLGINVWEDGHEKVAAFVKKKGDGMSYPVAYTGKGGAFEKEWLTPADVGGIPYAFVVKDGKVLFGTHPMRLGEAMIEDLLAGGEREAKVVAALAASRKQEEEHAAAERNFDEAKAKKDVPAMERALEHLRNFADAKRLAFLKVELLSAKEDWPGLLAALKDLPDNPMRGVVFDQVVLQALKDGAEAPEDVRRHLATELAKEVEAKGQAYDIQILSRLQWSLGDKQAAKESAIRSAEVAKTIHDSNPQFPALPFERFAERVQQGEMPSDREVALWTREALDAAAAESAPDKASKRE